MLCRRFRHAGNDQDLKEHAYGGPAGNRTRVQNTFCFASYSDNHEHYRDMYEPSRGLGPLTLSTLPVDRIQSHWVHTLA